MDSWMDWIGVVQVGTSGTSGTSQYIECWMIGCTIQVGWWTLYE